MENLTLTALRIAECLLVEAIAVHVYGGDEPPPDCHYTAGLALVRGAIDAERHAADRIVVEVEDEAAVRAGYYVAVGGL